MPGGRPPPPRRRPVLRLMRWMLRWGTVAALWAAGIGLLALGWFAYDLPNVESATRLPRAPSLTIEARDGSFLGAVGDLYGQPVDLDDHIEVERADDEQRLLGAGGCVSGWLLTHGAAIRLVGSLFSANFEAGGL